MKLVTLHMLPKGAHVAPARERGLKFNGYLFLLDVDGVAPARERGLKLKLIINNKKGE